MRFQDEITSVERMLMDILELAFLQRLPAQATLATLKARLVASVASGELVYVTAEARLYRWIEFSQSPDDGLLVIEPTTLPPGQTKGRWHRVASSVTFGPDGNNPLQSRPQGVCKQVLLYRGEETYDDFVEQVYGKNPCMFLTWNGDDPEPKSAGFRGSLYRNVHDFSLFIGSQCLRQSPAATWGSPIPIEAAEDPGINALIGLARYVLAGVANDLDGVEFVEIGAARKVHENLDERIFVYSLNVKVRTSFYNPDQDLIPLLVEVQPKWSSDAAEATGFDPLNYVQSGLDLAPGPGGVLSQSVVAGAAVIAGVPLAPALQAVTFAPSSDTYRDLLPSGAWQFQAVAIKADPPALAPGALRVAVTRTDASSVVIDLWLAAHSINIGDPYMLP